MKETPKAAAAFLAYYELGETRSLEKLVKHYQELAKTKPDEKKTWLPTLWQLKEWSRKHHWQSRVIAWEQEQAAERVAKRNAEIEEMNQRLAKLGMKQQKKAEKQIKTLIDAKSFGSVAAVQLLKLATDLERVARGVPTEIRASEVSGPGGGPIPIQNENLDLDLLTDEEFEELENLQKTIKQRKQQLADKGSD